jgi:peroxiredoxin
MIIAPFPPMWSQARAGSLKPGDLAPDFDLPRQGSGERVRLSQFRGGKPVVLVFGSYT